MPSSPEETRFVGLLATYYQNSRGISRQPPGTVTPSGSANKTMNTRKTLLGDKGTTGAGIQSIKQAGKARTNSTKE